ncbi:MAG: phosphoadenylyl-sulfate reductase [Candidatus Omnitrophica bacterium]|nr:phosphoadenylyl-sulfate reductase [Candidatus Omnitrophota bacterium]
MTWKKCWKDKERETARGVIMKQERIDQAEEYSKALQGKSVEKRLLLAYKKYGKKLGMTTGLGYSGMVLMHHIYKLGLDMDLYFIDTGFHFKETLDLLEEVKDRWKLNIVNLENDMDLKEYISKTLGNTPWKHNPNLCCHYCKISPLIKILSKKDAWISAIRRDQTYDRSSIDYVELDGRGTLRIYPMADWDKKKTWKYIKENDIPYNPLHDKGYMSIGCEPCTAPTSAMEDERDGRWKSSPKFDCGIHMHKPVK